MARKIYTQEQFENKLREEMEKAYQRRYEEERIDNLYRRMRELEERIYKLEGHPQEAKPCECVSKY